MPNTTNPVKAMFEMQRESIKHCQELFAQGLDFQQNAVESVMHNGLAMQRSAQRQGTELNRQVSDAQFDALEEAAQDEEFRETVDEQFEENARLTQDLLNTQYERGAALFQEMIHAQFDALESALDGDEFDVRSSIDQQFAEFERTQQEDWDAFEAQFSEMADDLSERQKIVLMESVTSALETQQEAEELTIETIQQVEETAETAQQQTHDVTGTVQRGTQGVAVSATDATEEMAAETTDATEEIAAETTDAIEDVAERGAEATKKNLQSLEGVGATYAERLAKAGIDTVDDLVDAQIHTVASAAEISEDRAEDWIDAAQTQE